MNQKKKFIELEEGWQVLSEGIAKARRVLEGHTDTRFTSDEFLKFYQCVYDMSVQRPSYCQELYDRYKLTLEQSVTVVIMPSLMDKHNEFLLEELVKTWSNYRTMARQLSNFFCYIDRYDTYLLGLPCLDAVATSCFCNVVCPVLHGRIRDSIISVINRDREGERINVDLLKEVLGFVMVAGMDRDLEQAIAEGTCAYYSRKASEWILEYSPPEYWLKVEECLNREAERSKDYFIWRNDFNRLKLIQDVASQLTRMYESQQKNEKLNSQFSRQIYVAVNQELLPRCSGLTLCDGNSGSTSLMDTTKSGEDSK